MVIIKVLKRKDGSSLVVGVVIAFIVIEMLSFIVSNWAGWLVGLGDGQGGGYAFPGSGWRGHYALPIVRAILQLLLLEGLVRLYITAMSGLRKK